MKFGLLKSKIEKCLVESYANDTIKRDVFVFNELIVKNKNINKLYYLYDELSKNKGLNESIATDFINECVTIYENTINKIDNSEFNDINMWVSHINTNNQYEDIDNLFSTNVLNLENKIKSKGVILESLKKSTEQSTPEFKNVSINQMVTIANKTIAEHLTTLSEDEQKILKKILTESDTKSRMKFDIIKEDIVYKLTELKESETDTEVISKIDETIQKVENENYDKLNYYKLHGLNRSL